jgi:hypothetical protein
MTNLFALAINKSGVSFRVPGGRLRINLHPLFPSRPRRIHRFEFYRAAAWPK